MAEPLGITSGVLAVLGAVKQLYGFIENIADAPVEVERAKSDLGTTVEVLEELRKYLDGRKTDTPLQNTSLGPVLSRCLLKCEALRVLLNGLVKHSGKFSLWDRARLVLKKDNIEELRKDISSARESLAVALSSLILVKSTNSHEAIKKCQDEASKATENIKNRMQEIQTTIKVVGKRLDEETKKSLDDQDLALREHLRLCEESIATIQKQARYKSEFGAIKTAEGAKAFAGIATKQLQGGVDQKFGDSDLGARSITFMGAGDTDAMLGFFRQTDSASQTGSGAYDAVRTS
ncbi:hypothetical protein BDW59DRAFT_138909 [Aspergillus cavernicola]|uniref:Azaphilone pigments biosynthesis cluster protein L N-terminal domain-containing protein n=1 Tax=Aspergillus cavernicola TaxID=176166 RepID=A0ABR4IYV0_9EURO